MSIDNDFAAAAATLPAISPDKQLLDAAERGDIDAAREALTQGANIETRDELSTTPLMLAVFAQKPRMVHFLLANRADVLAVREREGALHLAARVDVPEITETLLHHGAAAHLTLATANTKMTPLHIAAMTGSYDAARQLVQAGAAVNFRGENYMSAVDVAAQFGHADIIRLLVQEGSADLRGAREGQGFDPLFYAIGFKRDEAVAELLRLGVDPTHTDPDMPNRISLQQAADIGHAPVVKLLLDLPAGTFTYAQMALALGSAEKGEKHDAVRLIETAMRDYVINHRAPAAPSPTP